MPSFDRLVVEGDRIVHEVPRQGGRDVNAETEVSGFAFFSYVLAVMNSYNSI